MSAGNCVCGHTPGVHMHTNNLASCAMCECKMYKQASEATVRSTKTTFVDEMAKRVYDNGRKLFEAVSGVDSATQPAPRLAMNLQLLDGLVGQYALAHPNQEISRVTLIEFALWYQEKINGGRTRD